MPPNLPLWAIWCWVLRHNNNPLTSCRGWEPSKNLTQRSSSNKYPYLPCHVYVSEHRDFLRSFLQHKNSHPICHTPVTGSIKETVQCMNWETNIESGICTVQYILRSYILLRDGIFKNIRGLGIDSIRLVGRND